MDTLWRKGVAHENDNRKFHSQRKKRTLSKNHTTATTHQEFSQWKSERGIKKCFFLLSVMKERYKQRKNTVTNHEMYEKKNNNNRRMRSFVYRNKNDVCCCVYRISWNTCNWTYTGRNYGRKSDSKSIQTRIQLHTRRSTGIGYLAYFIHICDGVYSLALHSVNVLLSIFVCR